MESALRKRYDYLLSKIDLRTKEVESFCEFLHNETNWLEAPASTKYHCSEKYGLIKHSVGVAELLLKLSHTIDSSSYTDESCIICGLFHDVGKVGFGNNPFYIPNPNQSERLYRPFIINNKIVAMSHAMRSLFLLSGYINLSPAEGQAIAYHDGPYVDGYSEIAMKEEPLTLLLHFADLWHCSVME